MAGKRIQIFDTTLRDGEQAPKNQLLPKQKLILAQELDELGVDIIDIGFPASNKQDYIATELICRNIKNSIICVLARAKGKDIEIASKATKYATRKRIQTGISTSNVHLNTKLKISKETALSLAVNMISYSKTMFEDVQFYAEDAGRTDNEFLAKIVEQVIKAGATVINIPDTTGYCLPHEYGEKIRFLFEHVKGIHKVVVSCHCHNDLGLATANTLFGIENGARQIEVTINGVGERAGNTPLEEIAMILQKRLNNKYFTSIKIEKLNELSQMVSKFMNHPLPRNKTIIGENCFAHTSGIHQDGVIKNPLNYEIISPSEIGQSESKIILSSKSGRAALYYCFKKMGVELEKEKLNIAYKKFLQIAEKNIVIGEKELYEILKAI